MTLLFILTATIIMINAGSSPASLIANQLNSLPMSSYPPSLYRRSWNPEIFSGQIIRETGRANITPPHSMGWSDNKGSNISRNSVERVNINRVKVHGKLSTQLCVAATNDDVAVVKFLIRERLRAPGIQDTGWRKELSSWRALWWATVQILHCQRKTTGLR